MSPDNSRDELLRRFESAISGADLNDLRQMLGDLSQLGAASVGEPARPAHRELRRSPLSETRSFRVRVDLKGSRPRIWRRLELRSDLTLDVIHRVLQTSFSWTDTHLWRFSVGAEPFSRSGQAFLCPWDVEEAEDDDAGAPAASDVRLDEVMQEPGDVLFYVYDYGDSWELTLRLEDVSVADAGSPSSVVVGGRRAAPPEDCGGITDGAELAAILDDPDRFEIDAINALLRSPYIALAEGNVDPRLIAVFDRLADGPLADELARRAVALLTEPDPPDAQMLKASFAAFSWFLDRAAEGDIPLTAAGYLRPTDVVAAARVVPAMGGWIGKANRESETMPVLHFRQMMQSYGLLQKRKGVLRLTRAGAAAQRAPEALWNRLAATLVPSARGFDTDATLLLLAYAASSADAELPLDDIAAALAALGWRTELGRPVDRGDLYWIVALEVLRNVASEPTEWVERWRVSPMAAKLARAALQRR
jgi:Plasmid pRiA4b ORF-3-like protein